MRSTKSKTQFFNEMKKKPALQKILDNIETITWDEIHKTKQPKWIKDILLEMKRIGSTRLMTPELIAAEMALDNVGTPDTKNYATYRYTGETRFVTTSIAEAGPPYYHERPTPPSTELEIFNGELVLMVNDYIKVGHRLVNRAEVENQLQFVEDIESAAAFIQKKLDDDWDRLCPGEDRVEDMPPGGALNTKTINGVKVTFK